MDLTAFRDEVGASDPVTIVGLASRGGGVPGVRAVRAPAGIDWVQPDEMTVSCGAGTPVDELVDALADHGQTVALAFRRKPAGLRADEHRVPRAHSFMP